MDLLKDRRAETENSPYGESTGIKINVSEVLSGPNGIADYTVIDCDDSLVVINALTGLTPK